MLNIVIPMAGAGSRFASKGYLDPKPLIKVDGVQMIRLVIENLKPAQPHRFIFICQRAHLEAYELQSKLEEWAPGCAVLTVDGVTEGAACTVLTARELINDDAPLMIANSDQYVDVDVNEYLSYMHNHHLDGLIMTMKASDPKWSFVGLNNENLVTEVVEKVVISDEATVGIYNFRSGREFVAAADDMIQKNLRVNNEFYVAPVYNQLINEGANVGVFNVGEEANGMYGLGIPADLELFLANPICKRAVLNIK
jgi:dTDP-glucose pyrophosphorylase